MAKLEKASPNDSGRKQAELRRENSGNGPTSMRPKGKRWWRIVFVAFSLAFAIVWGMSAWEGRLLADAQDALKQKRFDYALSSVEYYLQRHPNDSQALATKARALMAFGRAKEAIDIFDKVGAANVEDLQAFAEAHLLLQHWSRAIPLLNRVLQLDPNNGDVLHEITASRVRVGQLNEALETAKRLSKAAGHEPRGYLFVGTIHGDLGNYREAAEAFAKVLEFDPEAKALQITPADFFQQFGRIHLKLGEPNEAIELLKRSVAARPSSEAFTLLGNAALELGEVDKAVQAWKKAIQSDPQHREAREALANLALQKNDTKMALEWLLPLENSPDVGASTAYAFQRIHTSLGNTEAAEKWREKAAELRKQQELRSAIASSLVENPNSFWSRVLRVHRYASEGNWDEAEILGLKLVDEAPGEPFVIELVGSIQQRTSPPSLNKLPVSRF